MKRTKADWVVSGGKAGEIGHCTRCGDGLDLGGPQLLDVAVAAMKAFVKAHSHCHDTGRKEEQPVIPTDWARGRDTGISSGTIYSVITGNPSPCRSHGIPHDPSDFGRCYRLLELFPAWKHRLGAVAAAYPAWKPFVREWYKLTEMYEAVCGHALIGDNAPAMEMYNFMQKLREEGKEWATRA
jgi:hypothetical protein